MSCVHQCARSLSSCNTLKVMIKVYVGSESPQRREGVATSGVALKTEVQEKEQVKVKRRELHKKEGTVA